MLPEWLTDSMGNIWQTIKSISFFDIIDIIGVAFLLYYVYKFIRDRRAGKLALGVVFIFAFQILSEILEMQAMQFILQNVLQVGLITLVVLFQPELRTALEKMGGESLRGIRSIGEQKGASFVYAMIDSVAAAVADMSASKTGALIVFERSTKLGDLILTGTVINADPSPFLIKNVFFNKAPLHDGALIIRDGRLYAAGCLLPLSANPDIIKDLGTRHRAAIGMSENSDAVVVVVSEETGMISVAYEGNMKRGFDRQSLTRELRQYLAEPTPGIAQKARLRFTRNKAESPAEKQQKGGSADE
ncbi:MAG: diadenylate cyclase CdaA [Clostridia bacterium]|nr:diadenylate cyclase CdaA [Clostridia bacterium]